MQRTNREGGLGSVFTFRQHGRRDRQRRGITDGGKGYCTTGGAALTVTTGRSSQAEARVRQPVDYWRRTEKVVLDRGTHSN